MNLRILHLKTVVIVTLLCAFWPISLIHADGLASIPAGQSVAITHLPQIAASTTRFSPAADMEFMSKLPARLSSQNKTTILSMEPLQPFTIGDYPVVILHLVTPSGLPIAKHKIRIFSYKNRKAEGITDSTGTVRIPLNFNFNPGTYDLTAAFDGSDTEGLIPSVAFGKLIMEPAQVEIRTVPPLTGIQFSFNNQILVSDANGMIHFTVDHIGTYHIGVLPVIEQANPSIHVDFYRWSDNVFSSYRKFEIPMHKTLEAGFFISNPVNLKYFDQANQPVDPARISLMNMRAAETSYTFKDPSKGWLPTNRLVHRLDSTLESIPATYYIENVTIDGSNVVNESQQRYQVQSNSTWPIKLFLFSAYFSARDALFHSPIGSQILLEYPDGSKKQQAFVSSSADINITSLPRGNYYATVKGAGGIEPRMPIALSRDQKFEVLVISRLDMAILFGIPAFIALLLLLVGRSRQLFAPVTRWRSRT